MNIFQYTVRTFPLKVKSGKFVPCILVRHLLSRMYRVYVESTGTYTHWYTNPISAVSEAFSTLRTTK